LDSELQKYYNKKGNDKKPNKKKRHDSEYGDESDFNEYNEDEEVKAIRKKYRMPCNTWIVKPGEDTNRGRGINVASDLAEIKGLVA